MSDEVTTIHNDGALINAFGAMVGNPFTGLGKRGQDKFLETEIAVRSPILTRPELTQLYRNSKLCEKVVELLPKEATVQGWLEFSIDKGRKNAAPKAFQYGEDLKLRSLVREASILGRLDGDGFIVMGIDDGREPMEPVDEERIQQISWIKVCDRYRLTPYTGTGSPGKPEFYQYSLNYYDGLPNVQGNASTTIGRIHHTRVLRFPGKRLYGDLIDSNNGFNDSVLQAFFQSFIKYLTAIEYSTRMVQDYNQFVYKLKGLASLVLQGKETDIVKRFQTVLMSMSSLGGLAMDENEEASFISRNFSGLDAIIDRLKDETSAAAAMPPTKLWGSSQKTALSNSAEGDKYEWADCVDDWRGDILDEPLTDFHRYMFLAKNGPTGGRLPESWEIKYKSALRLTLKEQIELRATQTEKIDKVSIDAGILLPDEVRDSAWSGVEYGVERTLNPELWAQKQEEAKQQQQQQMQQQMQSGGEAEQSTEGEAPQVSDDEFLKASEAEKERTDAPDESLRLDSAIDSLLHERFDALHQFLEKSGLKIRYRNDFEVGEIGLISQASKCIVLPESDFRTDSQTLLGIAESAIAAHRNDSLMWAVAQDNDFATALHLIGHQVHYSAGSPFPPTNLKLISEQAKLDHYEAFAECFTLSMADPDAYADYDPSGAQWVNDTFSAAIFSTHFDELEDSGDDITPDELLQIRDALAETFTQPINAIRSITTNDDGNLYIVFRSGNSIFEAIWNDKEFEIDVITEGEPVTDSMDGLRADAWNCTKGTPCKGRCIPKGRKCKGEVSSQASSNVGAIAGKVGAKSGGKGKTKSTESKAADTPTDNGKKPATKKKSTAKKAATTEGGEESTPAKKPTKKTNKKASEGQLESATSEKPTTKSKTASSNKNTENPSASEPQSNTRKTDFHKSWEKAFDNAPDDFKKVLDRIDQPDRYENPDGTMGNSSFFRAGTKAIHMDSRHKPGDAYGDGVYRHEYGHHLDYELGSDKSKTAPWDVIAQKYGSPDLGSLLQRAKPGKMIELRSKIIREAWANEGNVGAQYASTSKKGRDAFDADEKKLVARQEKADSLLGKIADKLSTEELSTLASVIGVDASTPEGRLQAARSKASQTAMNQVRKWAKQQNINSKDYNKMAEAYADQHFTGGDVYSLTYQALKKSNPDNLTSFVPRLLSAQKIGDIHDLSMMVNKALNTANASDMIGSVTRNRVGVGHESSYYEKKIEAKYAESFANVSDFYSRNDPLGNKFLQELMPNGLGFYKNAIAGKK